ncbi:ATP-grasp fold amidoligase family protein [Alkalicoccobacillus gibsonii]|uniref:ATP-grasp fold amidoligase family protein n=1 Tax=Alkalicoccobacillus gibsonii TaxID=79881 RepID=A0ABU9VP24_9BACI
MKKTLKKLVYRSDFLLLQHIKKEFKKRQGYELNLKAPQTFSEKIQYLKLYGNLKEVSQYVDKFMVRDYVKSIIGEQFLIPCLYVSDKADTIPFKELPSKFIIKATHSAGQNIIIKNKKEINEFSIKNQINSWLREDFYFATGQKNYKDITPRIIIEEFISDSDGELMDFKFFCFHGKPIFVQVDGDRFNKHTRNFYDLEWNKIDIKSRNFNNFTLDVPQPSNFDKMVEVVRSLANKFTFVRVDLYNVNGKIYFGELTFTPGNGYSAYETWDQDKHIGDLIIEKHPKDIFSRRKK